MNMWFLRVLTFILLVLVGSIISIIIYLFGHTIWLITKKNEKEFNVKDETEEEENE